MADLPGPSWAWPFEFVFHLWPHHRTSEAGEELRQVSRKEATAQSYRVFCWPLPAAPLSCEEPGRCS